MISSQSIAKNFTIQTIGKMLAILVGLVSIAIVTRALGTERFGEYTTAMTFLQFFGVIVDFGLTLTLIVMISEPNINETKIVGNFFGLRLVTGFIFFGIAPIVVLFFPWSDVVKQAVLVGSFAYFLMGGATMLVGIFQRHGAMWRSSLAELINRFVLMIFIGTFAFLHLGVVSMVVANLIANAIWLLSMMYFAKPFVRVHPMFDWNVWKKIFVRSWPIAISIIFNLMYLKGDILLLSFFKSQTEVGLYGVAYRVLDILTVIPTMFMGLILPSLTLSWIQKDKEKFHKQIVRSFDLFMIGIIPIIIGAQILGVRLIHLVAGNGFDQGGDILKVLSLALFGVFVGALFGHTVVAINKQRLMMFGYAFAAIITLIGYVFFIPIYGVWAAAWMTVFSETLIALITFLVVYKSSRALPNLIILLKALLSSFVMFVFLKVFPSQYVALDILFGALVYFVCMVLIKGITIEEIKTLFPKRPPKADPPLVENKNLIV